MAIFDQDFSLVDLRRLRQLLHQRLINTLDSEDRTSFANTEALRERIDQLASGVETELGRAIAPSARTALCQEVLQEVQGAGPLAALMADASVSDILINGPHEIWVDRDGVLKRTDIEFDNQAHLRRFLDRLIALQGKHLDTNNPSVDAKLPDGSRLHAMIPPLCANGPVVSIRRFSNSETAPQQLVDKGMLSAPMLELLELAVNAGLNVLVAGGAAAGKTTLLNSISQFIPVTERVITIEESAELKLRHPHVVTLEARQGNSEGRGQVDLRYLLRNALRMRADRIIVGEVRGNEVFDMLQAMTIGHDGSLSTVHANSPGDALKRLESLALMADVGLSRESIRDMIGSAIQLVVQVARFSDGSRCVTSLGEVVNDDGSLQVHEIFRFQAEPKAHASTTRRPLNQAGEHTSTGYEPRFIAALRNRGFTLSNADTRIIGGGKSCLS